MLALPFFLFNLKIAFIVFSPYYKCKTCSLTKKNHHQRQTERRMHLQTIFPGCQLMSSLPNPLPHMAYVQTRTRTCVYEHHDTSPCQDWDVAQCTACLAFVGPGPHPHSHRKCMPPCRLPNPSSVQALALTLAMCWLTQPSRQFAGDSPHPPFVYVISLQQCSGITHVGPAFCVPQTLESRV